MHGTCVDHFRSYGSGGRESRRALDVIAHFCLTYKFAGSVFYRDDEALRYAPNWKELKDVREADLGAFDLPSSQAQTMAGHSH
jgi:hypothetical protein